VRKEVPEVQGSIPPKETRFEWENSRGNNHETIKETKQDLFTRSLGQQEENPSKALDLVWGQDPSKQELCF